MRHMSIDIETYSSVDLMKSGLYKYAQAPDFQILLIAWAIDNSQVMVIDMFKPEPGMLDSLAAHLYDPNIIKHAYNSAFEWYCLNQAGFYSPIEQWRCTMLHGMYCRYPAGLGAVGEAIGLPQDKRKLTTGRALIRTFCVPRKPTQKNPLTRILPQHEPERWETFKEYCAQDVEAEREIERRLSPWPVPDAEQKLWELDQVTNAHGVAVDMGLVAGALQCSETITYELMDEAMKLTGLDNPKSVAQLKKWLEEEIDEDLEDLRKETVSNLLDTVEEGKARRVLEIRQELGKSSVSKYAAIQRSVCADGRVRGLLLFYGANRTGRWAGRIVQVQNLPQNHLTSLNLARNLTKAGKLDLIRLVYGNIPNTLSQLIRTAFIPSPGRRLLVADYSAIEARVVAWLAGETWVNEVFATHGKIYEASAANMFGVPIERIKKGNPEYELRQKGKIATLALGYGGSVGALVSMGALKQGLAEEELPEIVRLWRKANPRIVALWDACNACAISTLKTGQPTGTHGLVFALEGDAATGQMFLTISLPSTRKLFYARPYLAPGKFDHESMYYMGNDQKSKKWAGTPTFGGKLVENIVQAIARDCLAVTLTRLRQAGYETVFSVHDEVVIDGRPHERLEDILAIMRTPIPWATNLILNAASFETQYYMKD